MEYEGLHISSDVPNLLVNFRTSQNDKNIAHILKNLQINSERGETKNYNSVTTKIFMENGAA